MKSSIIQCDICQNQLVRYGMRHEIAYDGVGIRHAGSHLDPQFERAKPELADHHLCCRCLKGLRTLFADEREAAVDE